MLTLRISDEAREQVEAYCAANGITVTALFEAIGQNVSRLMTDSATVSLREAAAHTVKVARRIDAERRSRAREQD